MVEPLALASQRPLGLVATVELPRGQVGFSSTLWPVAAGLVSIFVSLAWAQGLLFSFFHYLAGGFRTQWRSG
jgi:hypothetical protein